MNHAMRLLINVIGLKVGWLACVLGAANGVPYLGPAVVALVVAVHLYLAEAPATELRLIGLVALIGLFWDSLLTSAGLMHYPAGIVAPGIAPYWIVAMWVLFATGLNLSLAWLKGRPLVAAIFGGVGGALAFYGGFQLGGVDIPALGLGLAAQGLGWALIMPLLGYLASSRDGIAPAPLTPAMVAEQSGS